MKDMVTKFSSICDFVFVYIQEAHPSDGWEFSRQKYKMLQHKQFSDRLNAATLLKRELGDLKVPLLVDEMSNNASLLYGAMPEQIFWIEKNSVKFVSGKGPFGFSRGIKVVLKKLEQIE